MTEEIARHDVESDPPAGAGPNRPRRRTTVYLLGFGLLTAMVMLLAKGPPVDGQNLTRVTFTTADVAQVAAKFQRTWSRPPTDVELQRAFEQYVRSEVLYREALARGLDRNDPVVRMSLVRKITMLGTAQAQDTAPTDEELEAYFELRAERYRIPATLSLVQIYLNPDRRGDAIDRDATELLARLTEENPPFEKLAELGDSFLLPNTASNVSEDELARTFGEIFRETVVTLPVGQWTGPVESGYGLHLVHVIQREDSRIPDWNDVRERVVTDLLYEGRQAAEDQFYAEVLPRYQVIYAEGVAAALEGSGALTPSADDV
jgi:hypothetical protein